VVLTSCEHLSHWYQKYWGGPQHKEEPLARVHNKYLYPSDVQKVVSQDVSHQDSLKMVQNYIDNWIKRQLVVQLAKDNLAESPENIEQKVEDYRNSLLTYAYEKALIKEKMDTTVPQQELRSYYNQNTSRYRLQKSIAQVQYLKLNPQAPNLDSARHWLRQSTPTSLQKLREYSYQYALNFTIAPNQWLDFIKLTEKFPLHPQSPSRFLQQNTYIERSDDHHLYLIKINNFALKGEVAPLSYVKEDIYQAIINKRKRAFIEEMYKEIYQKALKNQQFEVYF
jgi:hypothetical protein